MVRPTGKGDWAAWGPFNLRSSKRGPYISLEWKLMGLFIYFLHMGVGGSEEGFLRC